MDVECGLPEPAQSLSPLAARAGTLHDRRRVLTVRLGNFLLPKSGSLSFGNWKRPRDGRLSGVHEVRELGSLRRLQLRLHAVELFDVADLEGERRLPGEAHGEEREAVSGHLVGGPKLALRVPIINRSKIGGDGRGASNQRLDVPHNVPMLLPEERRNVPAGGVDGAVSGVHGGRGGQGARLTVETQSRKRREPLGYGPLVRTGGSGHSSLIVMRP